MVIFLTLLLVLVALLGAPLFVVLGTGALLSAVNSGLDPAVLIVELYRMASSPNLLAIPLFTLAGVTLAEGGAPQRLVSLFNALVGWLPGGVAIVALVSCAFFTAFSGASGITIFALGGLLYPILRSEGYHSRFSLGQYLQQGGQQHQYETECRDPRFQLRQPTSKAPDRGHGWVLLIFTVVVQK